MKYSIPVYRAEIEAGVADAIQSQASFAYVVPATATQPDETLIKRVVNSNIEGAVSSIGDEDLFYFTDILASVGWNLNDDIFSRVPVWAARHTNEDKPLNFEHDRSDNIGHVVSSYAVTEDITHISDDSAVDDIPDKYHVVNGTVIYRILTPKTPEEEARAAFVDTIISEIKAGEWFVSMECYFRGFNYGIVDPEGKQYVIARNAETAWLTKYLRAYPPKDGEVVLDKYRASGKFLDRSTGSEYRVGRVLQNITFSGKGLVRKPANPQSIILSAVASFNPSPGESVYLKEVVSNNKEEILMPDSTVEVAALQAQLDEARAALVEFKSKDLEATLAGLKAEILDKDKTVASLTAQVDTFKTTITDVTARAETAEVALATANATIASAKAVELKASRLALVVGKGLDEDKAASLLTSLEGLSEDAFASTIEVLATTWKKTEVAAPVVKTDIAAIDNAKLEPDVALAAAVETPEAASAAVCDFFSSVLRTTSRS